MRDTDKVARRGVVLNFIPPPRACCAVSNVVPLLPARFRPVMTCVDHLEILQAQVAEDARAAAQAGAPPWVVENLAYYAAWLGEFIAAIP